MKVIVQVPCFNEEQTLPLVINSIPKSIKGVDQLETMIIDDGSTDRTVAVAKELGVTHIVHHRNNKGLAASFADGINEALKLGADIIVNTDGDNQYPQSKIPALIQPILDGTHDIVVADRQTDKISHFSPSKKFLQRLGSKVVNMAGGTNIPDAPSGFRAYSREAAMKLNIVTNFSYCMETIIHAGRKKIAITHVPVETNEKTRESRLFQNTAEHVKKSGAAIVRSYTMHQPFKIFLIAGGLAFIVGIIPYINYLNLVLEHGERIAGHLQSLIFGAVFIMLGVMFMVIGIVADLLAINRKLIEDSLYRIKRLEYGERDRENKLHREYYEKDKKEKPQYNYSHIH